MYVFRRSRRPERPADLRVLTYSSFVAFGVRGTLGIAGLLIAVFGPGETLYGTQGDLTLVALAAPFYYWILRRKRRRTEAAADIRVKPGDAIVESKRRTWMRRLSEEAWWPLIYLLAFWLAFLAAIWGAVLIARSAISIDTFLYWRRLERKTGTRYYGNYFTEIGFRGWRIYAAETE